MKCPQCNVAMTPAPEVMRRRAVECRQCGGVWHDGRTAAESDDSAGPAPASDKTPLDADPSHFEIRDTSLECPRCESVPLRAVIDRHSNARSNVCGRCRGMWLTAHHYGDLLKKLSAEKGAPRGADEPRHPDDSADSLGMRTQEGNVIWSDVSAYFQSLQYKIFEQNPKLRKIVEGLERSLPL